MFKIIGRGWRFKREEICNSGGGMGNGEGAVPDFGLEEGPHLNGSGRKGEE